MAGGKKGKGKGGGSGVRHTKTRLRTARGRKKSSQRWLDRQLNDPFVAQAKREGYRSRAAYKLIELNEKFKFLKKKALVVDLGAAPGSWLQVATQEVMPGGAVIGLDLQEIQPIRDVTLLQGDFLDNEMFEKLMRLLENRPVDVVLSDMAAPACGHTQTDHLRIMGLAEVAADFAFRVLKPGGVFVVKLLRGGAENELLAQLKEKFAVVKHMKPKASRSDSAEMYMIATGFRK